MENFEVVDLTEFVRKILAEIAPLAHAADRDLELNSPGKVPAMVSTSALEEAIRNLVDNALRHTPPGSTVSVSVRPGATIEVRDRGPGVPLELREQVFEPFWSAACKSQGSARLGWRLCARRCSSTAVLWKLRMRPAGEPSSGLCSRRRIRCACEEAVLRRSTRPGAEGTTTNPGLAPTEALSRRHWACRQ